MPLVVHIPHPRPENERDNFLMPVFMADCGVDAAAKPGHTLLMPEAQPDVTNLTRKEAERVWVAEYATVSTKSGHTAYEKCGVCWPNS